MKKTSPYIYAVSIGCLLTVAGIALVSGSPGGTLIGLGITILFVTGTAAITADPK